MSKTKISGGHRPGAGRPSIPSSKKKISVTIRLSPDLILWLESQTGTKTYHIEKALNIYSKL